MDVRIAIEPLNRFESTIIHNTTETLSLARSVGHNSIGIVYDTFHASLEEATFIRPIPGRRHIDFRPIFKALKKVGYDGYVTLEAVLGDNLRQDLLAARKYLEKMID